VQSNEHEHEVSSATVHRPLMPEGLPRLHRFKRAPAVPYGRPEDPQPNRAAPAVEALRHQHRRDLSFLHHAHSGPRQHGDHDNTNRRQKQAFSVLDVLREGLLPCLASKRPSRFPPPVLAHQPEHDEQRQRRVHQKQEGADRLHRGPKCASTSWPQDVSSRSASQPSWTVD